MTTIRVHFASLTNHAKYEETKTCHDIHSRYSGEVTAELL